MKHNETSGVVTDSLWALSKGTVTFIEEYVV